jgi:hypothetical protein
VRLQARFVHVERCQQDVVTLEIGHQAVDLGAIDARNAQQLDVFDGEALRRRHVIVQIHRPDDENAHDQYRDHAARARAQDTLSIRFCANDSQ